ncbi:M23 family metallopeptidase [Natronogracilivirga saccharolytica]|uniref:M23 family metallopeptidase n=1 Tax=Natronogracilivirga saccharolytica TaxID=2812953 RepID=A0A8J7SA83_9BACT|nr:M23 family metallopeptidase [Natronogracilivirga saccharolytica]MBP3192896.1 M23 family metallopeptidase [Natronogracilivirga saccharolytica]
MIKKYGKNTVLYLSVFLLISYVFIPAEWIIIYRNLSANNYASDIIIPVSDLVKENIENTWGAPRQGDRTHQGIDLFASRGTTVVSAIDGVILISGRNTLGGNIVRILGDDRRIYYYAHLQSYLDFERGQPVSQGQTIGFVGNTGNAVSTPPHLHFEIMVISRLFPLRTKNINPYPELLEAFSQLP